MKNIYRTYFRRLVMLFVVMASILLPQSLVAQTVKGTVTDAITGDNELTIAWLSAKNKFALADFYKVTMSIVDPSTTYTNIFLHFAYGMGIFKYAPGVKFVAKLIEPGEITV